MNAPLLRPLNRLLSLHDSSEATFPTAVYDTKLERKRIHLKDTREELSNEVFTLKYELSQNVDVVWSCQRIKLCVASWLTLNTFKLM